MTGWQKGLSLFLICILLCGNAWHLVPLRDAKERLDALATFLEKVGASALSLSEKERKNLSKVRLYKCRLDVDGIRYFLAVLDGTRNRHAIHDPYYCLVGSGWQIVQKEDVSLRDGFGSKLVLKQGAKHREMVFWFSDGSRAFSSPLRYWLQTALRRMTFGLSGSEPVLVMVQSYGEHVSWKPLLDSLPPRI